MFYIENKSNDPHFNLALEEYAVKNVCNNDKSILLLWRNNPSVIIGNFQNTAEEINNDFIEANHINVVRRITGGGAVYHDLGNLNYSFIVPDIDSGIDFKTFIRPLINALESLGIRAEQTGRNDVTIDGSKFSGTAQYYFKNRLLHHGTILFDSNLDDVASALKVKPGKIESKGIKSVRSRVTNLKSHFQNGEGGVTVEQFQQKLLEHFDSEYGLNRYVLTEAEQEAVLKLKQEKYDTWEWNYGKSPKSNVVKRAFLKCGYVEFHFFVKKGLITEFEVVGDFFSSRDINEFRKLFIGMAYDRGSLRQVLESTNVRAFLGDTDTEEILTVMC